MSQYKVVEVFELDSVMQVVDSVVELADEVAAPFVEAGKLVLVPQAEATPEGETVPPAAE